MTDYQTTELWLSENCSMAFVRVRDSASHAEHAVFVHIVRHEVQLMRLMYSRPADSPSLGPRARCDVFRLGTRTVVAEQNGDRLQLLIASSADQHRSIRFTRIEPEGSHAARQLMMFLDRLAQKHNLYDPA